MGNLDNKDGDKNTTGALHQDPVRTWTIPTFSINPDAPKTARRPDNRISVAIDMGDPAVNRDELIRLSALHVLAMGPDSGLPDEELDKKI